VKKDNNATTYAKMGVAALLPGMVHMLERMQSEIDSMRAFLGVVDEHTTIAPMPKRSRPHNKKSHAVKGYWAKMTPEERQVEMARRVKKRKQGKQSLRHNAKTVTA
jgi:hypothetical protein